MSLVTRFGRPLKMAGQGNFMQHVGAKLEKGGTPCIVIPSKETVLRRQVRSSRSYELEYPALHFKK